MKIGTGYFAKAKEYHEMGYVLVSIARTSPWFLPKELLLWHLSALAPTGEIIGTKNNPQKYEEKYNKEILANTSAEEVLLQLERYASLSGKDKVVLLCYESPEKFCHRHLIADWLNEGTGMNVQEIKIPTRNGSTQKTFSFFKETSK